MDPWRDEERLGDMGARPSDRSYVSAAAKDVGLVGLHHHGHAHAATVPLGEQRASTHSRLGPLHRRELVRHQECTGVGAEDANAVAGSAADEQARECEVVIGPRAQLAWLGHNVSRRARTCGAKPHNNGH